MVILHARECCQTRETLCSMIIKVPRCSKGWPKLIGTKHTPCTMVMINAKEQRPTKLTLCSMISKCPWCFKGWTKSMFQQLLLMLRLLLAASRSAVLPLCKSSKRLQANKTDLVQHDIKGSLLLQRPGKVNGHKANAMGGS